MKNDNQWIWVVVVISAVLLFSLSGFAGMGGYGMMGGGYGMMSGFGMGLFGWLFMLLIVIALVLFIVWLIKQMQEPNRRR